MAVPASVPAPKGSTAPPEHEGGDATLIDHLVYKLAPLTGLIIMPLFALANTAVVLDASLVSTIATIPLAQGTFRVQGLGLETGFKV